MAEEQQAESKQDDPNIAIRYDKASVTHTTQFLLSANSEEVIMDCSSGPIAIDGGEQLLPIHSRHAIPWSAVRRLSDSLRRMLEAYERQNTQVAPPHFPRRQPGLPRIEEFHA